MSDGADLCDLPYVRFAGCLLGGQHGVELFETLVSEFDDIGRHDAFLGISIAIAQLQADLLISEMETKRLRLRPEPQAAA